MWAGKAAMIKGKMLGKQAAIQEMMDSMFGGGPDSWSGKGPVPAWAGGPGSPGGGAAAPAKTADFDTKVARVKAIQRQEGGKELWIGFIQSNGGGKNDPSLREESELDHFLSEADPMDVTIAAVAKGGGGGGGFGGGGWGKGKAMGGGKGMGTSGAPPSEEAIARVKAVQRMEGGKDLWTAFLERVGGSARDPARRTADELEQFLAESDPTGSTIGAASKPTRGGGGGGLGKAGGGKGGMDDWWSMMMDPWGMMGGWGMGGCGGGKAGRGGKSGDQGRRFLPESEHHANLIARVKATQKQDKKDGNDRWAAFITNKGGKRDPASRTTQELEEYLGEVDPEGTTSDVTGNFTEEMSLVAQIKFGQRNSEIFKQAWVQHCEANAEGLRDPTKHKADFLREFLASAPEVMTVESDDEHRRLVETIKEGQRTDENYKEAWWKHVELQGSTFRDPAKHDKAFLQAFVSQFAPGQVPAQPSYGKFVPPPNKVKGGKGKGNKSSPYEW